MSGIILTSAPPPTGILSANNAGIKGVWVITPKHSPFPVLADVKIDGTINDFYGYKDILKKCTSQLFSFERRWNVSFRGTYEEKRTVDSDVYDNNFVINDKMEEASNLIRTYLASWDDIE